MPAQLTAGLHRRFAIARVVRVEQAIALIEFAYQVEVPDKGAFCPLDDAARLAIVFLRVGVIIAPEAFGNVARLLLEGVVHIEVAAFVLDVVHASDDEVVVIDGLGRAAILLDAAEYAYPPCVFSLQTGNLGLVARDVGLLHAIALVEKSIAVSREPD